MNAVWTRDGYEPLPRHILVAKRLCVARQRHRQIGHLAVPQWHNVLLQVPFAVVMTASEDQTVRIILVRILLGGIRIHQSGDLALADADVRPRFDVLTEVEEYLLPESLGCCSVALLVVSVAAGQQRFHRINDIVLRGCFLIDRAR